MIGKIIMGTAFKGVISYCLSPKSNAKQQIERSEIIDFNNCFGSKKELINQFNDVRNLNPKVKKPVMHFIISLPSADKPDNNLLIDISKELAKEFKFSDNQYIVIRHYDTDDTHPHIHIIVNRIGFDKVTVSDSHSYKRISEFARRQEIKHSLQQVKSPNCFLPAIEQTERTDKRKQEIKSHVKEALSTAQTIEQFRNTLSKYGIQFETGRGIIFFDNKIRVKGSDLNYSFEKIKNTLKENILKQMPQSQRTRQLNMNI